MICLIFCSRHGITAIQNKHQLAEELLEKHAGKDKDGCCVSIVTNKKLIKKYLKFTIKK